MTAPGNDEGRTPGSRPGGTPGGASRPGGLAEEIVRLVETVALLAGGHAWSGSGSGGEPGTGAGGGPECRGCPVCRLVGAVRTVRPEVIDRLVAAGVAAGAAVGEELLAVAREFAASTEPDAPPRAGREGGTDGPRGASRPARTVQRIELE